jgi:hypothetical protein
MRIRWKAAALILPVLAALAGCGRDVTTPDATEIRALHDDLYPPPEWPDSSGAQPDTVFGDTPYHGSGHRELPGAMDDPGIILE